jgi:hypothetical protein
LQRRLTNKTNSKEGGKYNRGRKEKNITNELKKKSNEENEGAGLMMSCALQTVLT